MSPKKLGYPDRGVGQTEDFARGDYGAGPQPPQSGQGALKAQKSGGKGKKAKAFKKPRARAFGGGY